MKGGIETTEKPSSDLLKNVAHRYSELGLNVVPLAITRQEDEWKKEPLVQWKKWIEEKQTEEEFNNLPWDICNGFAVILGKLSDGNYFCCFDYDAKHLETEAAKNLGRKILEQLPETYKESTINQGIHAFYISRHPPKTESKYHDVSGVELLGNGKLCVLYPSIGYKILQDLAVAHIENANELLEKTSEQCGIKVRTAKTWFDKERSTVEQYRGRNPPCIVNMLKGVPEGERNETCIRLSSYFRTHRQVTYDRTLSILKHWNENNRPPLPETEIINTLKSAEKGGYAYSCNDQILGAKCPGKDKCFLASKTLSEQNSVHTPFIELKDGRLAEQAYDGEQVFFLVYDPRTGIVEKMPRIVIDGATIEPIDNDEVRTDSVLLPSDVEEYESEEKLDKDIKEFLDYWHEAPDELVRLLDTAYVRLSYVQDLVPQTPYLSLLADYGKGKSAWLDAVGSICYRPVILSGSDTDKSIVRKLHNWRGTALIDEADFSKSDLYSFIVKILNIGYDQKKGWYNRASENDPFKVFQYYVYCCKLLARRARYKDMALESRCLTSIGRENLKDIPLCRMGTFDNQALHLRNRLLLWRFRNYSKVKEKVKRLEDKTLAKEVYGDSEVAASLSSRIKQVILPLWLIGNECLQSKLIELARKINARLKAQDWKYMLELEAKSAIKAIWEHDQEKYLQEIEDTDKGVLEREGKPIQKANLTIGILKIEDVTLYTIPLSTISKKMITLKGIPESEIKRRDVISHSKSLKNLFEARLGFNFQIDSKNQRVVLIPFDWLRNVVHGNEKEFSSEVLSA